MCLLWEQMHRPIVSLQRCFPHAEGLCFLLLTGARLSTGQNGEQIIAQQSAVPGATRSRGKLWCTLWRPSAWRPLGSQGVVCLCGLGVSVTQWTSYNSAPSCKQQALRMSMAGGPAAWGEPPVQCRLPLPVSLIFLHRWEAVAFSASC